jgi:hypothetical protein
MGSPVAAALSHYRVQTKRVHATTEDVVHINEIYKFKLIKFIS